MCNCSECLRKDHKRDLSTDWLTIQWTYSQSTKEKPEEKDWLTDRPIYWLSDSVWQPVCLSVCSVVCLSACHLLTDWVAEFLIDWRFVCLFLWMTDWMADLQADWLSVWHIYCLSHRLTEWLTDWWSLFMTIFTRCLRNPFPFLFFLTTLRVDVDYPWWKIYFQT